MAHLRRRYFSHRGTSPIILDISYDCGNDSRALKQAEKQVVFFRLSSENAKYSQYAWLQTTVCNNGSANYRGE